MSYPGYCAKYGTWMPDAAMMTTAFLGTAVGGISGAFNEAAAMGALGGFACGAVFGTIGVLCAFRAHRRKDLELSGKGVGMTRGGEIVRRAQFNNFIGPALLGLVFSVSAGVLSSYVESYSHKTTDNAAEKSTNQPVPQVPERIPAIS